MSLVDPDTLMPKYPPGRWARLQQKALVYGDSYEEKKASLEGKGWVFTDPANEADKRATLHARATFTQHDNAWAGEQNWYDTYAGDNYLMDAAFFDANLVSQVWQFAKLGLPASETYDTWVAGTNHFLFAANDEAEFKLQIVAVNCCRVLQILIAQTIEVALCLDNRGRPRIH